MNMQTSIEIPGHRAARALWEKTMAEYEAAKRALEHHNATSYDPLYEELERIAPRPSLSFEIEALNGQVARYHVDPRDLHAWDDHWSPLYRRKAAAVREAWLEHRRQSERLGTGAAGEESDRLCNFQCDIEGTLIKMPAPDHAAFLWKLEQLFGPEARDAEDYSPGWCAEWMNAVMDDARRLLGREAGQLFGWREDNKMAA